jgi:hypothetical protein
MSFKQVAVSLLILVGLLAADVAVANGPRGSLRSSLSVFSPRFKVSPDGEIDVSNYYEGLINEGGKSVHSGLLTNQRSGYPFADPEYAANRRVNSPAGPLRTNAFGMVDRDYSREKPPDTRRILLFGDSLGRAMGVPQGKGLEPRLEDWLNGVSAGATGRRVEILNFATSGHRAIRALDYAIRRAPGFSPDVFLLELGRRNLPPGWASDIVTFGRNEVVPPYSFIRDLIQRAGVTRDDSRKVALEKLDAIFDVGMRRVLTEFKATSAAQRVEPLVLLLPTVEHPRIQSPKFDPLRSILKDLGLPVIDLVDAFRDVPDPSRLGIDVGDPHPNEEGQTILFARLIELLDRQPEILTALLGSRASRH